MAIELLEREVMGLTEEDILRVIEFVRFIKYEAAQRKAKSPKRVPGHYSDQLLYIADDFDDTPEGFEEYM